MINTAASTTITSLHSPAGRHIDNGVVPAVCSANQNLVLERLNDVLAIELVCVMRYRHHHLMADGIHARVIAKEFLIHSVQELAHADQIAKRIVQLGGKPDFSLNDLTRRSHAEYIAGESLIEMIRDDLVAERIAIDSYRAFIEALGDQDPTTRQMLEGILAVEQEHADELAGALDALPTNR